MKALLAEGVCHAYGKQVVLKDFALELEPGAFVALMGPSGSGKSTFLHLAAGLLAPEKGVIAVGGTVVTGLSDADATKFRRRHEGVVFQAFNLIETMTVAENIVLSAKLDGARTKDASAKARVGELLARLGLEGLEKKYPTELSGGEQQRVAIARALYSKPAVILADEPTGNLDAKSAKAICALLKDVNAQEKCAILLVTHDPQVAASATEVAFLKDGRVAVRQATEGDAERVSKLYLETYDDAR